MGVEQYNTLMVYGFDDHVIEAKKLVSDELLVYTTPIIHTGMNAFSVFYIVPCGGKVGWATYKRHILNLKKVAPLLEKMQVITKLISVGELGDKISEV